MTQYPDGHKGYTGRLGEKGTDDDFVSYNEAKRKSLGTGLVVALAAVAAAVGTGVAYQQGLLDGLIGTVKQNETVKSMVGKDLPKGTVLNQDENADRDDLKVRRHQKEKVREVVLDPLEENAATPQDKDDMVGTFKYVDGNGDVHVVDHYSKIPKAYRKRATKLEM